MQRLRSLFPRATGSEDSNPRVLSIFGNLSQRILSRRVSPGKPPFPPPPSIEQIATILDLLPTATGITDLDGMILHLNQPFASLLGERGESGKGGRNVFDVISSTSADKLYSCIIDIRNGKSTTETGAYISRWVKNGKAELKNCIWTIALIPGSKNLLVSIRLINDLCGDLTNEEGEIFLSFRCPIFGGLR